MKVWFNKEMRIGRDKTGCAHFKQEDEKKDAYIMLDGFWMIRIPYFYSMIKQHRDDLAPNMERLFQDQGDTINAERMYLRTSIECMNGCKRVYVFENARGKRYGYNADILDRYVKADDTVTYRIGEKSGILWIYQFDTPDMIILPIKPPAGKEW